MRRPGQPVAVAARHAFLVSYGVSYRTGQVLHPNRDMVING
ncbi:MAG: hypothetical protein ACYCXX_06255 [Acidiferrobacter thiooxydans]|jgi:hypothetical protein